MKILITGGMGFIGINAAVHFVKKGHYVTILDNLNKTGLLKNFNLMIHSHIKFEKADIRIRNDVDKVFDNNEFNVVLHLAGQTAVTKSVDDPETDFATNAIGTFNLLEATRFYASHAKFIYASTNKVYGNLTNHQAIEMSDKYDIVAKHIDETEPLDFHSPYGCSKGAADQYVRDYHRIYGLDTNVVRQSCIYGPHQDGTEDQGWVAWFIKAFLENKPITIYGDGKQVRDILYVEDLLNFYEILIERGPAGEVYNLGGGRDNVISLIQFVKKLQGIIRGTNDITFAEERPGDQKVFISNNGKAESLGWKPSIPMDLGIELLIDHLK